MLLLVQMSRVRTRWTAHYTSHFGCTCAGFKNRGVCTHQLACQIVRERSDAPIVAKVETADAGRQRRYEALFADDEPRTMVTVERPCAMRGCPVSAGQDSARCPAHTRRQRAAAAA